MMGGGQKAYAAGAWFKVAGLVATTPILAAGVGYFWSSLALPGKIGTTIVIILFGVYLVTKVLDAVAETLTIR